MQRALWLALVAACGGGGSGDDFPVEPGGPPGKGNVPDAAMLDAADDDAMSSTITGRVCIPADLRAPTTGCAASGAGGIAVTLGTKTTTTMGDGTFVIARPSGSGLVWTAERLGTIVKSVMPFKAQTIIPAFGVQDYVDLQNANNVTVVTGSIIVQVVKAGAVPAGVDGTVSPPADNPTHYAGNGELVWPDVASGTSASGMFWIPNAMPGPNTVTATPDLGAVGTAQGPVEEQAITFLTIELL